MKVRFVDITMRKQIAGLDRHDQRSGESLGRKSLNLPETTPETSALYFIIPQPVESMLRSANGNFTGAIHAAEHAMIPLFPLQLVCDHRYILQRRSDCVPSILLVSQSFDSVMIRLQP